jgi:hypothetical protein
VLLLLVFISISPSQYLLNLALRFGQSHTNSTWQLQNVQGSIWQGSGWLSTAGNKTLPCPVLWNTSLDKAAKLWQIELAIDCSTFQLAQSTLQLKLPLWTPWRNVQVLPSTVTLPANTLALFFANVAVMNPQGTLSIQLPAMQLQTLASAGMAAQPIKGSINMYWTNAAINIVEEMGAIAATKAQMLPVKLGNYHATITPSASWQIDTTDSSALLQITGKGQINNKTIGSGRLDFEFPEARQAEFLRLMTVLQAQPVNAFGPESSPASGVQSPVNSQQAPTNRKKRYQLNL